MAENITSNNLESEIAELSRQIENKKRALEAESGIVREEKEVIAETVAEHFYDDTAMAMTTASGVTTPTPIAVVKPAPVGKDYLDTLPAEAVESINSYVAMIPKDGIRKTVARVQAELPFLIDAFHDALVTRLYDELKERGLIK